MIPGCMANIIPAKRSEFDSFGRCRLPFGGHPKTNATLGFEFGPAGSRDAGDRNSKLSVRVPECAFGHFTGDLF